MTDIPCEVQAPVPAREHTLAQAPAQAPTQAPATRRWPRLPRRGRAEIVACVLITLGILMLLQPFSMLLYTWSFVTMLVGTVMFMIVSKFPQ